MLAKALTRIARPSLSPPVLPTVYRRSMNGTAAVAKGLNSDGSLKKALIPFSSRLLDGRALAQDVWSIYKYAPYCMSHIAVLINVFAVRRTFQQIV